MKKLIFVLVTNTLLTGCANLSHSTSADVSKAINSLAPVLVSTNSQGVQTLQNSFLNADTPKRHHRKDKKETATVSSSSGKHKHNHKHKPKTADEPNILNVVTGQKDMVKAVGVITVAAADTLAVIGGKLANYFTEQDKVNSVTVLKNTTKTRSVAWCSDSKEVSENVEDLKCSKSRKITQTPGAVSKKENKICRSLKTEVVTESGEIKTENQNLCQAEDGEWYEAKTS